MDKNELIEDRELDEIIGTIYHAISNKFTYMEFGNDFLIVGNGSKKYYIKITKKE